MSKFQPGDVVNILIRALPGNDSVVVKQEGVLVYQPDWFEDGLGCFECHDADCSEWVNVLLFGGSWRSHVRECNMELSDFGRRLREKL